MVTVFLKTLALDFACFAAVVHPAKCGYVYLCTIMQHQARDGNNNDREFGGDEFEVNILFRRDEDYGEDEPYESGQEDDEADPRRGDGTKRSRITVRMC